MTLSGKRLPLSHRILGIFVVVLIALYPAFSHAADGLKAAVAANFMVPFQEIAAAFEEETKIKVDVTYSSTGSLYSQIINGAPYDVFLSADEEAPRLLFEKGLGEKPLLYATGKVVLWGAGKEICGAKDWKDALKRPGVRKIAIANPVTAPYGAAAEAAMKKAGLWDGIRDRLVLAQNVGQSFQYAVAGGTDGSFCALSAALSEPGARGCYYLIDEAPAIRQAASLLARTTRKSDASRLIIFLNSPKATEIKKRYGYY
jgi:molybdate transport system substrate-binding protein